MADNLPLIPRKRTICKDVRPLLRTVFRELDCLPPLAGDSTSQNKTIGDDGDCSLPSKDRWIEKYKTENKDISNCEDYIKDQFAKRITKQPLPNIYKIHHTESNREDLKWKLGNDLIDRKDLRPGIQQNAGRHHSLWIKNILNTSSCNMFQEKTITSGFQSPMPLSSVENPSFQKYSIGEEVTRICQPPVSKTLQSPQLRAIICIPLKINFVNCSVGHLHTKSLRLINVSKYECRLSISPMKHRELDIEISGTRGLTVTAGAAAELKVHFRPTDVRALDDVLTVRVSCGQILEIPIASFMEPPILNISVSSLSSSQLMFNTEDVMKCKCACGLKSGSDMLELGSRLLGDIHCVRLELYCDADLANFFIITEDAWINWNIDCLTKDGSVVASPFVVWPAWWRGGGVVRGCVWCCPTDTGAHHVTLRVLSSTAITRHLHLLADVLYFKRDHLTIQAHEKDYDICSDEDPDCEYYVNLGTAFPHRSLFTNVQLINKSPIAYNYYWNVRPWGVCSCLEEDKHCECSIKMEDISDGNRTATVKVDEDPQAYARRYENTRLVKIEPDRGLIMPRFTCPVHVQLPDVGEHLGIQRAVFVLILQDIPKESIAPDYEPMIVKTREVESPPVPGVQSSTRVVLDVVVAQMEVWWEVAPVRFVVDPPVLPLYHSRRVKSTDACVSSWLLFGCDTARVSWIMPAHIPTPSPLCLTTTHCASTNITVPLPFISNQGPESEVIKLVAENDEWYSQCIIQRKCETRYPSLHPAILWLGVVPPGTAMDTTFCLMNDTYQHIYYSCKEFRWWGENTPRFTSSSIPCDICKELPCSCALVTPRHGALDDTQTASIHYKVNAPMYDGCVAMLIQARSCDDVLDYGLAEPATGARASLVMYRVLAPRLTFRLLPCSSLNPQCSVGCELDAGALGSERGTAVLRPASTLVLGRQTCYRLLITNITPLMTEVHFDIPLDGTDTLNVKFIPNDFRINGYGQVEIKVVLDALRVCDRRIFVYRALVENAYMPIYLIVDTAIAGLQVSCQVPVGGDKHTDDFVIIRKTQRAKCASEGNKCRPCTHIEIFAEEDRKREIVKENICRCPIKMVYIPPVKRNEPMPEEDENYVSIDIVEEPPPLTRICGCEPSSKPLLRDLPESISLQFINLPLRKVCERRLVLRNESAVTAHWSTSVRRWPRQHVRTLAKDQWASDVCSSGVVIACSPVRGVLSALETVELFVQVYADCWGLYCDQILIQVDNLDPLILDVWIEVVGAPLQVLMQNNGATDEIPTMWLSTTDSNRSLRVKNMSRSELIVYTYQTQQYECMQDVLPFRLYFRFYDLSPVTCPCYTANKSDLTDTPEAVYDIEMETGIDLYLAPDYGPQNHTYYKVNPEVCCVKAGDCFKLDIAMNSPSHSEHVANIMLMLRPLPIDRAGDCWYRPEPPVQLITLRPAVRVPRLQLCCDNVTVNICALDLPQGDTLRIQKCFCIQNIGNGSLDVNFDTATPWCVVQDSTSSNKVVSSSSKQWRLLQIHRDTHTNITVPPESSAEICVEVKVCANEAWPQVAVDSSDASAKPEYPQRRQDITPLHIYNDSEVLLTLPLILDIEYPIIHMKPAAIDFGVVTDGDSRKTYISVSHTSRTKTLQLVTRWVGCEEFDIWPQCLEVPPAVSKILYIQYTAVWRHGPAEGYCHVAVSNEAGDWCYAAVTARATPSRDHNCHTDPHDHTDDEHLLPTLYRQYN